MPWWVLTALALTLSATGSDLDGREQQRTEALRTLAGATIRVSFTNEESPLIFKEGGEWTGVLPEFLEQLIQETGFIPNFTAVSAESVAAVGTNLNTACPRDISRNLTDLCIGNPWVTTQRLGYTGVLPTLWKESITLTVTLTEGGFQNSVLQTFKPLNYWLWLAIALVIACYAAFSWRAESGPNNRDFPIKEISHSGPTSIYYAFYGFFWSEPATRPVTAEGRVLDLGFGFFLVLMLSGYTASLATVLVNRNKVPEFTGMGDAIQSNTKLCMRTSMLARAANVFPELNDLALAVDSWTDGYNRLDAGECGGLLIDPNLHAKQQEKLERDCDKVQVGGAVVGINCAWFVADRFAGPLSFFVSDLMERGVLDELRRTYFPRILCGADEGDSGLYVQDVGGILFITGAFLVLAILVHGIKRSSKSPTVQRRLSSLRVSRASRSSQQTGPSASLDDAPAQPQGRPSRGHAFQTFLPAFEAHDPSFGMVEAFHEEPRLVELPYEKTLLTIAQARSAANQELMSKLSNLKIQKIKWFDDWAC